MEKIEVEKINIININNDCLTTIFTYLNCCDLFNLKDIHPRFNTIVESIVNENVFHLAIDFDGDQTENHVKKLLQMANVIKFFGKKINSILIQLPEDQIRSDDMKQTVKKWFKKICNTGNFESGTLVNFMMDKKFILRNKLFFTSLKSLTLYDSITKKGALEVFNLIEEGECKELKVFDRNLKIENVDIVFSKLITSKLETLVLRTGRPLTAIHTLPQNSTLKHLNSDISFHMDEFRECFPKLETYGCEMWQNPFILSVLKLPNLKTVEIVFEVFDAQEIDEFLNLAVRKNTLESLRLHTYCVNADYTCDIGFEYLTKLTNLKKISLALTPAFEKHWKEFGQNLTKLCELEFSYIWYKGIKFFGENDAYKNILNFVAGAKNLNKLDLIFDRFTNNEAKQFYRDLIEARQQQNNSKILKVTIHASNEETLFTLNEPMIFITFESGKYVHLKIAEVFGIQRLKLKRKLSVDEDSMISPKRRLI